MLLSALDLGILVSGALWPGFGFVVGVLVAGVLVGVLVAGVGSGLISD